MKGGGRAGLRLNVTRGREGTGRGALRQLDAQNEGGRRGAGDGGRGETSSRSEFAIAVLPILLAIPVAPSPCLAISTSSCTLWRVIGQMLESAVEKDDESDEKMRTGGSNVDLEPFTACCSSADFSPFSPSSGS